MEGSVTKTGSVFGATLLVAGTCIGGGMLALPIVTAEAGFLPAVAMFGFVWAVMVCTGLCYLEASLWLKKDANLISMSGATMGRPGKTLAWTVYLAFFYCLTVAYVVGGGTIIGDILGVPDHIASLGFVLFISPFIFLGPSAVNRLNWVLMGGLIASYIAFVVLGFPYVEPESLTRVNWSESLIAIPTAFTAFGYQGVIPTVASYLNYDFKRVRRAVLLGSGIPLIVYCIWEALILGVVPLEGEHGLLQTLEMGRTAAHPLGFILGKKSISVLAEVFGFFALATSFLGVTLPLRDFLADGLRIKKTRGGRLGLVLMIMIPVLLIAKLDPTLFLTALKYAGGYGGAIILVLLPTLIVFVGRYRLKWKASFTVFGGQPLLIGIMAFAVLEVILETCRLFGLL